MLRNLFLIPRRGMATATIRIARGQLKNKVNSLGFETRKALVADLTAAYNDKNVTAIVVTNSEHSPSFCAGADITEFSGATAGFSSPTLADVQSLLSSSPKPTVAAIQGVALGGGLELALCCHYRVASPSANVGLPEVKLGIIPGAGGTVNLPRLTGVSFALEAITSGRMIDASSARRVGILDGVAEKGEDVVAYAERFLSALPEGADLASRDVRNRALPGDDGKDESWLFGNHAHHDELGRRVLSSGVSNAAMCDSFKAKLPPLALGGDAVRAACDSIKAGVLAPSHSDGLKKEYDIFAGLLKDSVQGKGRRHAFFAERSVASRSAGASPPGKLGNRVGVIGAGTMGSGIATCFLRAGYDVTLVDANPEGAKKGRAIITDNISQDVKRGRATQVQAEANLKMLKTSTTLNDLKEVDLVVEAVFENMDLKKKIFKELDGIVRPDTLLCSNTSTLDVDALGSVVKNPDNTMGMHFFSPANVMKLVENVRSKHTSDKTVSAIMAHTKKIGKVGVVVGNCDGFVGNRMVFPYTAEAVQCLEEGASVEAVDGAITAFGMAIGPLTMGDIAGNDIGVMIRKEKGIFDSATRPKEMRYTSIADDLVAKLGRIGQKAGKGWYDYDPKVGKGRVGLKSAQVAKLLQEHCAEAQARGVKQITFTPEELVKRNLYPLVNEAFKILEEGIAKHPDDVDIIYLYGYGWPAWRGGPVWWADQEVGLKSVLADLEKYAKAYPGSDYFKPSKLLIDMVAQKKSVYDHFDKK